MAWDQETDDWDKEVMEMLQALKIRNSLVLQEFSAGDPSLQLAEQVSKPKVEASKKSSGITVPQPFQMMLREAEKRKEVKPQPWADLPAEQSADDAECLKQFRAQPVPAHVFLPMYSELMEQNEKRRKSSVQKRGEHLLSMQKPFQLLGQDRRRQVERTASAPTERAPGRERSIPKSVLDPTVSDRLREAEILRKINSNLRAKDLLESSSAPVPMSRDVRNPHSRTCLKTKQQRLGFLQQNLTFKPHINPSVPDFQTLYRNFQKHSLKKQSVREATESKPFNLRTSSLSSKRLIRTSSIRENLPQRPSAHLSSLSPNTLPVYITDGTKRREVAIRSSLQDKDLQDIEREKWLHEHRQKSLSMQSSLSRRAKALDPHKPLASSNKEKLQQKRRSERRRAQEYKEELEEMMRRVGEREYLFERVTKGRATKDMERRFTQTLAQAGLNEEFVQQKGEAQVDVNESEGGRIQVRQVGAMRSLRPSDFQLEDLFPGLLEGSHVSASREGAEYYKSPSGGD